MPDESSNLSKRSTKTQAYYPRDALSISQLQLEAVPRGKRETMQFEKSVAAPPPCCSGINYRTKRTGGKSKSEGKPNRNNNVEFQVYPVSGIDVIETESIDEYERIYKINVPIDVNGFTVRFFSPNNAPDDSEK